MNSVSYKRSLVIGTLLGDAFSRRRDSRSKMRAEYTVVHCLQQLDFAEWKAQEIGRLYKKDISISYYLELNRAYFSINRAGRLRVIHDWFHRNGKKVITKKIRFMDHPIGLTMLLCDDGSVRKRKKTHKDGSIYYLSPSITIATHCFDKDSVNTLLEHIENLCGARGYINPERRIRRENKVEYNRVNFNAENSRKLWDYVKRWLPKVPSMLSKFSFAIERYGID